MGKLILLNWMHQSLFVLILNHRQMLLFHLGEARQIVNYLRMTFHLSINIFLIIRTEQQLFIL